MNNEDERDHAEELENERLMAEEDGPTFSTPDVLRTGQTGWDIGRETRCVARALYRQLRTGAGQSARYARKPAATMVAQWLDNLAHHRAIR